MNFNTKVNNYVCKNYLNKTTNEFMTNMRFFGSSKPQLLFNLWRHHSETVNIEFCSYQKIYLLYQKTLLGVLQTI